MGKKKYYRYFYFGIGLTEDGQYVSGHFCVIHPDRNPSPLTWPKFFKPIHK